MINLKSVSRYSILMFITCSLHVSGQTQDTLQKKSFYLGNERLKLNDLEVAHSFFKSAYFTNADNELGKKSLIKLDSLTSILRKKHWKK